MNILDRAIAQVAPGYAARRVRDRMVFDRLEAVRAESGYDAAKRTRSATRNWNVLPRTADEDTLPRLAEQRARSRDMMMNAPIARGAVNTVVTSVVGTGLTCSAQADRTTLREQAGLDEEAAEAFERAAQREWRLFCRAENADARGRLCFEEMQELALRAALESGDCFAAVVQAEVGAPFDFRVQLLEADRVGNPSRKPDNDKIAGGVEMDASGRPVAVHVCDLPRDGRGAQNWRRLAMRGADGSPLVLHLMQAVRIDQSRGVPYLAPVTATLKDLGRYTEAEVTAAVLTACIAILGEGPDAQTPLRQEAIAAGGTSAQPGLARADITFEPGMVLEGFMPGETVKSFSTDRPSAGFDPFVQAVLRQVGVALELPFELLVKHFTASYSAARAALLQAWQFFRSRRTWLARGFCQPVYELVIANAVMKGRLEAPGFFEDPLLRMAYCGARWTGPSPGQINPEVEVGAAEKRIAIGVSTKTRETAELTGDDWEAVAAEAAREAAYERRLGIERPAEPEARAPAAPPPRRDDAPPGDRRDRADRRDGEGDTEDEAKEAA